MNDDLALLTVADVAGLIRRPRAFVLGLIREGKLPVVRLDDGPPPDPHRRGRKDYRVSRASVAAFLEARTARVGGGATPPPARRKVAKPAGPVPSPSVLGLLWDGKDRTRGPKSRG